MSKFLTSHWWATFFILFFPLAVMYGYVDFIRESEINARVGWLLLIGGLAYLFRHSLLQKFFLAILIAFVISGALDILYAVTFSGIFKSASLEALIYTDSSESLEFLIAYISLENSLLFLAYIILSYISLRQVVFQSATSKTQKFFVLLGVVMLVFAVQQINDRGRYFDVVPGFAGVALDFSNGRESLEEVTLLRQKLYEENPFVSEKKSDKAQTYVVVIGESLNRNHMSLYGYGRDTTPNLVRLAPQSLVFTDVVSAFAQTRPSLSVSLTQVSSKNLDQTHSAISLMEVFKRAGFETWWISNQQPLRYPTSAIASLSDHVHFISHDFYGVEHYRYDGYMTPYYEKALASEAKHKVIFVHMMGSHLRYESRYPAPEHEMFNNANGIRAYSESLSSGQVRDINYYDNSVHYTDSLLGDWIGRLGQTDDIAGLLFFADHGEEIFDVRDFKGHGPDAVTHNMVEIPLIFWRNQAYQSEFSEVDLHLQEMKSTPFMLDDLFHLTICLTQVKTELYDSDRSLCSLDYKPKARVIYGQNYEDMIP